MLLESLLCAELSGVVVTSHQDISMSEEGRTPSGEAQTCERMTQLSLCMAAGHTFVFLSQR